MCSIVNIFFKVVSIILVKVTIGEIKVLNKA